MIREAFLNGTLAATLATLGVAPSATPSPTRPLYGSQLVGAVPDFTLPTLDGPAFALSGFRGHGVWVNFFAAWCDGCQVEQPVLTAIAKEFYRRGLRVVGVDPNEAPGPIRTYRKRFGIDYPIALDKDATVASRYTTDPKDGALVLPTSLFVDPSGRVVHWCIGPVDENWVRGLLPALLTGSKV